MQYVQDSRIKGEGEGGEAARLDGWFVGWLVVAGGTKRGADDVMWRMGIQNRGSIPAWDIIARIG